MVVAANSLSVGKMGFCFKVSLRRSVAEDVFSKNSMVQNGFSYNTMSIPFLNIFAFRKA